jgi:hypothetical protein
MFFSGSSAYLPVGEDVMRPLLMGATAAQISMMSFINLQEKT